jgi:hypothetical protein
MHGIASLSIWFVWQAQLPCNSLVSNWDAITLIETFSASSTDESGCMGVKKAARIEPSQLNLKVGSLKGPRNHQLGFVVFVVVELCSGYNVVFGLKCFFLDSGWTNRAF